MHAGWSIQPRFKVFCDPGLIMASRRTPVIRETSQVALVRTVYEGLRDEIVGGKLMPGEALSRRQIASRYGTSYIPVIEAMARLESAGLIDVEARQVARVRKITVETIEQDYVLREAFETQAIRLTCATAIDDEIEELYRLAESVDQRVAAGETMRSRPSAKNGPGNAAGERTKTPSPRPPWPPPTKGGRQLGAGEGFDAGVMLHWRFHRRIAEISRSRALIRELERIELLRRLQANWYFTPEIPDEPRCHSLLVDFIKNQDPVGADAAMRRHVRRGLEKELMGYRMKIDS